MRIPTNLLAAAVASLIVYGGWQLIRSDIELQRSETATRQERLRFAAELRLRSALAGAQTGSSGWVYAVEPNWFRSIPRNHLLPNSHAWLEIATPEQSRLRHPTDRMVKGPTDAAWWYNPATGDLRARVPPTGGESQVQAMYANVND